MKKENLEVEIENKCKRCGCPLFDDEERICTTCAIIKEGENKKC